MSWRLFLEAESGDRFRSLHEFRRRRFGRSTSWRVTSIVAGTILILIGAAIGWLPGPGGFVALIGAGLIAAESRHVADLLDRVEVHVVRLWSWAWTSRSGSGRVLAALLVGTAAAAAAYAAGRFLLG